MSFDLQQLIVSAATIDELLGSAYQPKTGQKDSTDCAALKLAAWCRSAASGDWGLLSRRLGRDNLSIDDVLSRFADVNVLPDVQQPAWFIDSQWVYQALVDDFGSSQPFATKGTEFRPFEKLFYALVERAEINITANAKPQSLALFNDSARIDLRCGLLKLLSDLYAPLLYSRFVALLKKQTPDGELPSAAADIDQFDQYIADIRTNGFAVIFAEKPVLLRLTAITVRQWIDTSLELVTRLGLDAEEIKRTITGSKASVKVHSIRGDLSDPHNFGHSVQIITFEDETKVVYKPKDLRLDVAWHDLISIFNASSPPVDLKAVKILASHDYGWTEFIDHTSCASSQDFEIFYRRAGAWLALFHVFASTDMHFENILANGSHPVPIDLEMILQASAPEAEQETPETAAMIEARKNVVKSVLMVGMLPAYTMSEDNRIYDAGGLNAVKSSAQIGATKKINTDGTRLMQIANNSTEHLNIPHSHGQYAQLGDYLSVFIKGFDQYSHFLLKQRDAIGIANLLRPFKQVPVRKVINNTRFYYMLLQRLKDHRNMGDGVTWSAQAEFLSRLADLDAESDLLWPLQRAERLALVNLNVPHFVSPSDEDLVTDITGHRIRTNAKPGLEQAAERLTGWSEAEIDYQIEIIKISTSFVSRSDSGDNGDAKYLGTRKIEQSRSVELYSTVLAAEAARIAATVQQHCTVKDRSAAWIGLDWLGDSEVGQLVALGSDLYNGSSGIALFLAAYSRYANDPVSRELALKALAATRQQCTQPSAARWARGLGIGGASGLGSVIYALTVTSGLLNDDSLLKDACAASNLFSKELISADISFDVIAGSAGGILSLLALYRKTQSSDVLAKAVACGEHLLQQPRKGAIGLRSWVSSSLGETPLTGFSHGSAGYAHALSSLAKVTQRDDFAQAAQECLAYEKSLYDKKHLNWPDLRAGDDNKSFPSQWCHGAIGIGLARIATSKSDIKHFDELLGDINNAIKNATTNWPQHVDSLCCGTLGSIEFLAEAGVLLNQPLLCDLSNQRLAQIIMNRNEQGDYKWNAGSTAFNLGLFRGLSGVGYTILRRLDPDLPNVLIWE